MSWGFPVGPGGGSPQGSFHSEQFDTLDWQDRTLTDPDQVAEASAVETAEAEAWASAPPDEIWDDAAAPDESVDWEAEGSADAVDAASIAEAPPGPLPRQRLLGRRRGKRLVEPEASKRPSLSAEQRLLLLDTWKRSGLPAGDFAALVGMSKHTLYAWDKRFQAQGPAGLMDQPRGAPTGSKLPELTKRTILLLKREHPEWGCQRISDLLVRGPALPASASAVARVLHEAGYQMEHVATHPHPDKPRRFERAQPNQLWQTDLFTFVLKRQNRRVHLVGFIDDHSRFVVGFGLHASASTALVIEGVRAAIGSYGPPAELLTDNGPQYVTWRGKSQFTRELERLGIKQLVAKPRRPQTLGKIERFWGTLWRECVEAAVFVDLADARLRIGHFVDHYNFQRPHRGIDGLVPADRFFGAAKEVRQTLQARVAANALELARHGAPKAPFYVTGQVAGQSFSVHAAGERVVLVRGGEPRQEVELVGPATAPPVPPTVDAPAALCPHAAPADRPLPEAPPPGVSLLDEEMDHLMRVLQGAAVATSLPAGGEA